jgi:hypothetical protein
MRSPAKYAAREPLTPVAGLGPFTHVNVPIVGTDNFDFMLVGVANLVANQESANYQLRPELPLSCGYVLTKSICAASLPQNRSVRAARKARGEPGVMLLFPFEYA